MRTVERKVRLIVHYRNLKDQKHLFYRDINISRKKKQVAQVGDEICFELLSFYVFHNLLLSDAFVSCNINSRKFL
jgi:hypothetical protein